LLIALLAFAMCRPARALEPREAARAHYARGLALASQNGYAAALLEFNEAYAISPQFAVLYNIGQAHVALGHPLEAIAALSQYLRDGQDHVPPARRAQVGAQIALLESTLAELAIGTDRPGARIDIDGREVGRTPLPRAVRIEAGTHTVSARLEGALAVSRIVTLREGGHHVLELELPSPNPSSELAEATRAREAASGAAAAVAVAAAESFRAATADARPKPAASTLAVRCGEPGVKVLVDGKSIDAATATRGLTVAPGAHRLSLAATGRRPAEQSLEVPAGATAIVLCQTLGGATAAPRVGIDGPPVFSSSTPRPTELPAPPQPIRASTVGLAITGVGVALGGAALGVYIWNRGQVDDANAGLAYANQDPSPDDRYKRKVAYNEAADTIHSTSTLTVGLAVASAAVVGAGLYLWLTHRKTEAPGGTAGLAAGWGAGPGGISWSGVW
jgi:hypothetical protein